MIGAIAGDIIGSVYEWNRIKTKQFNLFSPDCHFTDDSVLTIALVFYGEVPEFITQKVMEILDQDLRKITYEFMELYCRHERKL